MTLKDGLGSILQVHGNWTWIYITATVRLKSLLAGYVVQFGLTWLGWRWWKGRKRNETIKP